MISYNCFNQNAIKRDFVRQNRLKRCNKQDILMPKNIWYYTCKDATTCCNRTPLAHYVLVLRSCLNTSCAVTS